MGTSPRPIWGSIPNKGELVSAKHHNKLVFLIKIPFLLQYLISESSTGTERKQGLALVPPLKCTRCKPEEALAPSRLLSGSGVLAYASTEPCYRQSTSKLQQHRALARYISTVRKQATLAQSTSTLCQHILLVSYARTQHQHAILAQSSGTLCQHSPRVSHARTDHQHATLAQSTSTLCQHRPIVSYARTEYQHATLELSTSTLNRAALARNPSMLREMLSLGLLVASAGNQCLSSTAFWQQCKNGLLDS